MTPLPKWYKTRTAWLLKPSAERGKPMAIVHAAWDRDSAAKLREAVERSLNLPACEVIE